jgi:hypothetical protein
MSICHQAELLGISRSSIYYEPVAQRTGSLPAGTVSGRVTANIQSAAAIFMANTSIFFLNNQVLATL